MNKIQMTISGVLADLAAGLTRTKDSKSYKTEVGCIQDKYGLSNFDMKQLFKHKLLKSKKTHGAGTKEVGFILVDDTAPVEAETIESPMEVLDTQVIEAAEPVIAENGQSW